MFDNRPARDANQDSENSEDSSRINKAENENTGQLTMDTFQIRDKIQKKLLAESDGDVSVSNNPQMKQIIETYFNEVLQEENRLYTMSVRSFLLDAVMADILGYGPIAPLLEDEEITEVMVNGTDVVYVEKNGTIEETNVRFEDNTHLMRIIDRIVSPLGRRVDESSPMVDARLPNGYRVNATIPPLSLNGPILTIRKFANTPFTDADLIDNKSVTDKAIDFLRASVEAKINIVISGGTGSGKTTLLNVISSFIPTGERIITIEDTAELQINQKHVIRLEKRPPNVEGEGEVTIRQLVINALRMRPDRIIVGETRGGEALDMLQAMNTGHDGSLTTVHSNSPRDTVRRIEVMVLMAGMDLPLKAIREQIASSINLIIQTGRLRDGSRKVLRISEIQGMEGETIILQDIFLFNQTGVKDGAVLGKLQPTGLRPKYFHKFAENGIKINKNTFVKSN